MAIGVEGTRADTEFRPYDPLEVEQNAKVIDSRCHCEPKP